MAINDSNSVEKALYEILNKSHLYNSLKEDQQDVAKYLTEFTKEVNKATDELSRVAKELEDVKTSIKNKQDADNALFDEYKTKFLEIMKGTNPEEITTKFQELIETIEKETKLNKNINDAKAENLKLIGQELKAIKAREDAEKALEAAALAKAKQERLIDRLKQTSNSNIGGIFQSVGMSFKGDPTHLDPLYAGLDLIRNKKTQDGISLLATYADLTATAYSNMLDPLNIFVNMISQIKKQTLGVFIEVDKTVSEFVKATGASREFGETIVDAWDTTRAYNVTLAEMSDTMQSLMRNYRGFTGKSSEAREDITIFTSLVARLGVGTEKAAKTFAYFSDTLKLTDASAKGAFSSLLGIAKVTGDSLEKVVSDFSDSMPSLARYGQLAPEIFRKVYATAKALRIETKELLDVTKQFDTFEDAAQSVGKLNALMGGPYLNAIKMMNQSEDERIVTLNRAFKATGRSYDSLSKYAKQALATAAGISDMELAQRVFGGSTADAARYMRQASMDQAELAKQNKEATEIAKAFQNVLMQLGKVFMPIIDAVRWLVGGLASLADAMGPFSVVLLPAVFMLGGAILGLKRGLLGLATTIATKVAGKLGSLVTGLNDITGAGRATADALREGVAPQISNVARETANAAAPVSKLSTFMTGMGKIFMGIGPMIASVATGIATAITEIGLALGEVALPLAGFIALVGGAATLVYGLYKAVTETPSEELEDLVETVGKAGPGIGENMKGIGVGLGTLLDKFNTTISQSTVETFTDLMEVIADNSDKLSNTAGIGILDSYTRFLEASNNMSITPAKIEGVGKLTENLTTLSKTDGIVPQAAQVSNQKIDVKVYIDGSELTDKVVKVTKSEIKSGMQVRT